MKNLAEGLATSLGTTVRGLSEFFGVHRTTLVRSMRGERHLPSDVEDRYHRLQLNVFAAQRSDEVSESTKALVQGMEQEAAKNKETRRLRREWQVRVLQDKLQRMESDYAHALETHRILTYLLEHTDNLSALDSAYYNTLRRQSEDKLRKNSLSKQEELVEEIRAKGG
jgi:hypothetical protein